MIRICFLIVVAASVATAEDEVKPEYCIDYHPQCPVDETANSTATHLPVYQDCHKFYKCDYGRACVFSCPTYNGGTRQLVFNPKLQVCDYPWNVPGLPNCEGESPTNPPPTYPPITYPPPTNPPITYPPPTYPPITYPPPTYPPPTYPPPTYPPPTYPPPTYPPPTYPPPTYPPPTYPPPTNPPVTYPPVTQTTPGGSIPADCLKGCPVSGRGRVRHPTSCNYYYDCADGKYVLRKCLENLYFNCYVQACDRPQNLPPNYPCSDLELGE